MRLEVVEKDEIFKTIKNHPNFQVSNYGRIYNIKKDKFLKGYKTNSGVCVTLNGKSYLVHILVAKNFLDNPENYKYIIHKDDNYYNNNVSNLIWVSSHIKGLRDAKRKRKLNEQNYKEKINQGFVNLLYKEEKIDGYLINKNGLIYSNYKNGLLKQTEDKDGYLQVMIKHKKYRVASLVAYTFIGLPNVEMKDPTINHIDNNKKNNNYLNLEWMERGINSSIRLNTGEGSLNPATKVTNEMVEKICDLLLNTNLSYKEISEKVGVGKDTVARIKQKRSWKKIVKKYPLLSNCRKIYRDEMDGTFFTVNPLLS